MEELQRAVKNLDPEEALSALAQAAKGLLANLGEEAHLHFLMDLLGQERGDKLTSMVHLWLATCMGEGVDPSEMCQSLVHKVQRSRKLLAQADPEIVLLFEEWLEALEEEAATLIKAEPTLDAGGLALKLGISPHGARFLLERLKGEEQE